MRTGLTVVREPDGIKFYGEISDSDFMRLKLSGFEKTLLDATGWNAPAEDMLLALEMIFRNINEQLGKKEES